MTSNREEPDLFYFDVVEDGASSQDAYGVTLPSWGEAQIEAEALACEIMRDRQPMQRRRSVAITVRATKTVSVYQVRIALDADWVGAGSGAVAPTSSA